ncbi:hypothetical protein ACQUJZ_11870 [Ralstonia pseudosolanacearum]
MRVRIAFGCGWYSGPGAGRVRAGNALPMDVRILAASAPAFLLMNRTDTVMGAFISKSLSETQNIIFPPTTKLKSRPKHNQQHNQKQSGEDDISNLNESSNPVRKIAFPCEAGG